MAAHCSGVAAPASIVDRTNASRGSIKRHWHFGRIGFLGRRTREPPSTAPSRCPQMRGTDRSLKTEKYFKQLLRILQSIGFFAIQARAAFAGWPQYVIAIHGKSG